MTGCPITLHRTYHSKYINMWLCYRSFKDFIKARNPSTFAKAIQAAREEERVTNSLEESKSFLKNPHNQQCGKTTNKKPRTLFFHCRKMGHWAKECRYQPNTSQQGALISHSAKATVNTITCRYCKKPGHTKEVCRKLKYVNSKKGIENLDNSSKSSENQSQSDINDGRSTGSIKTATI